MSNPQQDINNANPAHQGSEDSQTGREDSRPGQERQGLPAARPDAADKEHAAHTTPERGGADD